MPYIGRWHREAFNVCLLFVSNWAITSDCHTHPGWERTGTMAWNFQRNGLDSWGSTEKQKDSKDRMRWKVLQWSCGNSFRAAQSQGVAALGVLPNSSEETRCCWHQTLAMGSITASGMDTHGEGRLLAQPTGISSLGRGRDEIREM